MTGAPEPRRTLEDALDTLLSRWENTFKFIGDHSDEIVEEFREDIRKLIRAERLAARREMKAACEATTQRIREVARREAELSSITRSYWEGRADAAIDIVQDIRALPDEEEA